MFKGKIINRYATIRSRQVGAWSMISLSVLIGVFSSSGILVYVLMALSLGAIIFIFLFGQKVKEANVPKGFIEIDEFNLRIISSDRNQVLEVPITGLTSLHLENTEVIPDNKWYQFFLDMVGSIKHPTIRFEYDGERHQYCFTIDSFYMHEKLSKIQAGLIHSKLEGRVQPV